MMRWLCALAAAGLVAAPSAAARAPYLDTLLKGRTALPAQRCIFPDRSAQVRVIDGTAIVYRGTRYTYVARFKNGCPQLREDRRITTRSVNGQLCENDAVYVSEATGHDFGFCTFEKFVPYRDR